MGRISLAVLLATIVGLAVALWMFGRAGIGDILAIVGRMGVGGFLLYCLWSCGVFVILGAAWLAAAPGEPVRRLGRFTWARAVREAVADLLPLSQIGGIIVGARTLIAASVPTPRTYASLIVDMTTELTSQLLFTAFGIIATISLMSGNADPNARPIVLGAGAALMLLVGLVFAAQRLLPGVTRSLAARILPKSVTALQTLHIELAAIYAQRQRVLLALAFNLAAWTASAGGAWLLLQLVGADISVVRVLALESLIFTLRSVAFVVPGGLGVQEAGYALLATLFGLPLDAALALALAKRARDLALGLPTILIWQLCEVRMIAGKRLQP